MTHPAWQPEFANQIYEMRKRMEETASTRNLKRSAGGIVDIEFLAQMLQLEFAVESPIVMQPGTIEALTQLEATGHLDADSAKYLCDAYRFLRSVEARLRLMNTTARHDLPNDENELDKLAYLFGATSGAALAEQCRQCMHENRECFDRLFKGNKS